jgi:hypothetical protein
MADYEVFLEDMTGQRVGQLPFESLQITLRYNEPGRAKLTLPAAQMTVDVFDTPYRLLVRRNDVNIISGMVTSVQRAWDTNNDQMDISITDDLALLDTRLIVPVPNGPPYTSADHDVRTGAVETVMHAYVNAHAGAGAIASRRIAGLTQAADQARGGTVTARGRFLPLLSMVKKLATLGGLGFRVVGLQFQVYQPSVTSVTFSAEMNNLLKFVRTVSAPGGNYVYAGGGGEGTSRVIAEAGSLDSIMRWGRREMFLDQRNTSDISELQQAITARLNEQTGKEETIQFEGTASLDQVGLGDIVSVAFGGAVYPITIQQITIRTDGVSEDVIMTSGTEKPDIYRRMDDAESSIALLEVR